MDTAGAENVAARLSPRLTSDVLGRIRSIKLIKCMEVQPPLKFLVKNNVQLESCAQILVVNFIIALLASNIQAFTLSYVVWAIGLFVIIK